MSRWNFRLIKVLPSFFGKTKGKTRKRLKMGLYYIQSYRLTSLTLPYIRYARVNGSAKNTIKKYECMGGILGKMVRPHVFTGFAGRFL